MALHKQLGRAMFVALLVSGAAHADTKKLQADESKADAKKADAKKADKKADAKKADKKADAKKEADAAAAATAATDAPPKMPDVADPMLDPLPAPPHVLKTWREALNLASAEDPEYSVSLLEVDRAEGQARQTLGGVLPSLTGSGNVTFNIIRADVSGLDPATGAVITRSVPDSPTASMSLTLRQSLIAPRVWWAIGTSERVVDLAKTNIDDRQRVLVGAVADAIVSVVTAERTAEVNRVGLRAALERLVLEKKRLEIGAGTALDVVRFEQDVALARGTLIQGDETLRQSRERLGLALGSIEPWGVRPDISLDGIEGDVMQGCKRGSLDDRADLRAQRLRMEIADRAITDSDLLYLPTADLSSTLTYSSQQLVGDGHAAWSVSGVLTVPIWDGGVRYGVHRSAVAASEQESERLDAATRGAKVELNQSDRSVTVAISALAVAKQSRDLSAETDRLAKKAFDNGDGTAFDLVDAARNLRQAELSLAVRELDLIRAKLTSLLATANCTR